MKIVKLFLIAILCIIAAGCFSSYQGQGTFTIDFGDISTGLSKSDDTPLPEGLYYTVELIDGPGPDIGPLKFSRDDPPHSFTVAPGSWTVVVKAYYEDGTLYAESSTPQVVEIKAGKNEVKEIRISLVQIDGSISFTYLQDTTFTFTPLESEKTGTVDVTINWLKDGDTADVVFSEPIIGVSLSGNTGLGNGTHPITIIYNGGTVTTPDSTAALKLDNYDSEKYTSISGSQPDIGITIYDGAVVARSIPVRQDNIIAFNTYANTQAGLSKNYKLEGNINLTDIDWDPIGIVIYTDQGSYLQVNEITSTPFSGIFDGADNEITGLTINKSNANFQGLFEYIGTEGTVKNLKLSADITGARQVGGIAGHNRGTIENCFVSGNITGRATVGGIAGHNERLINRSGKTGGTVTTTGVNDTTQYYTDAGGVAGYNSGTVSNSYNLGNVSSTAAQGRNIGGVVGYNQNATAKVEFAYNTGNISGLAGYIGGIAGWNSGGNVSNTVSLGLSVTSTGINAANIGRVIGSNEAGTSGGVGTGANNYASDIPGTWSNIGGAIDGATITSANWTSHAWWTDTALFTDNWWNGKLPLTLP